MKLKSSRWLLAAGLCLGASGIVFGAHPASSLPSPNKTVQASEPKPAPSTSFFNWIGNKPASGTSATTPSTSAKPATPAAKTNLSPADERQMFIDLNRGTNYEAVGEFDKARKIYEELRVQFPKEPEPAYHLGVVADQQRKHQEAEQLFAFALQKQPQNASYCGALGYCYFLQGKFKESEQMLIRAANLAPKNVRIRNNLGLALGQQGKYGEALKQFAACGSEADAYFNLAYVYALQDKTEEAKQCFRKALTIDPTHEKARNGLGAFVRYETLPAHLQEGDDYMDDNGIKWVPYNENATSGSVQQTGAQLPTGRTYSSHQRELQNATRGGQAQNMQSQREVLPDQR